jgi:general stress protein YciG
MVLSAGRREDTIAADILLTIEPLEKTSGRGLKGVSVGKRRSIASKAGKKAHEVGNAHEFSSETGRKAGKKGGLAVSQDREYMAHLGAMGGKAIRESRASGNLGIVRPNSPGTSPPDRVLEPKP